MVYSAHSDIVQGYRTYDTAVGLYGCANTLQRLEVLDIEPEPIALVHSSKTAWTACVLLDGHPPRFERRETRKTSPSEKSAIQRCGKP